MVLDDFTMLGKTVPEPQSDGRVFVCSAGVSTELRALVRIYPLARHAAPSRWAVCRVPLERNPKDSRWESWKVAGDRRPGAHERVNEQFKMLADVTPGRRAALLAPYVIRSIADGNARRLSLGILHPEALELFFEHNPSSPDSPQLRLFEDENAPPAQGAKRFPFIPRLRFHDADGWHELMLRDWGCYEFMRKHPEGYYRQHLAAALHLDRSSSLLVGNQNNRRTAWLVISVLNGLRQPPALFEPAVTRPAVKAAS